MVIFRLLYLVFKGWVDFYSSALLAEGSVLAMRFIDNLFYSHILKFMLDEATH